MSPKEQRRRIVDLWVLDKVKRGKMSLTGAAKEQHVTPKSVVRHTGAFTKVKGRWIAQKSPDRLEMYHEIFVDGQILPIITNDSRQRSKINRYKNAVAQLWYFGNKAPMLKLGEITVKDHNGVVYTLDTDPESVSEILSRLEGADVAEPYDL